MNRSIFTVAASVFALFAVACHSIDYTPLNAPPHAMAPREPASIEVFAERRPERPIVEVGLFEIEQNSPASGGMSTMVDKLRVRAAELGCDGILLGEATERVQSVTGQSVGQAPSGGVTQGFQVGQVNSVRGRRAVCFVYRDAAS